MRKFELPAITKEMDEKRIEEKIQKHFEGEIKKFFTSCANSPFCKTEREIGYFVCDLDAYPEDRVQEFIDGMVSTILTLNYEHHGQVTVTKLEKKNLLYGMSHKPAYSMKFVYIPLYRRK